MISFRPEGLKNTKGPEEPEGGGAIRPLFSFSAQSFVIPQITQNGSLKNPRAKKCYSATGDFEESASIHWVFRSSPK
jgi:hypothetical protein